jgi:hypothetical protein
VKPNTCCRLSDARRRMTVVTLVAAALSVVGLDQTAPAAASSGSAGQRRVLLTLSHPSAALARFVAAVSSPASPEYRRYETIGQLVRRFGASRATQRIVLRWLHAHHVRGRLDPLPPMSTSR